ncbi:MAG: hypothetical protein VKO21_07085 [Candidatus Sericytochromatia bacterium]|nr:hypothetical protein [Candidatus Sericytochromatia bacterium]
MLVETSGANRLASPASLVARAPLSPAPVAPSTPTEGVDADNMVLSASARARTLLDGGEEASAEPSAPAEDLSLFNKFIENMSMKVLESITERLKELARS